MHSGPRSPRDPERIRTRGEARPVDSKRRRSRIGVQRRWADAATACSIRSRATQSDRAAEAILRCDRDCPRGAAAPGIDLGKCARLAQNEIRIRGNVQGE